MKLNARWRKAIREKAKEAEWKTRFADRYDDKTWSGIAWNADGELMLEIYGWTRAITEDAAYAAAAVLLGVENPEEESRG